MTIRHALVGCLAAASLLAGCGSSEDDSGGVSEGAIDAFLPADAVEAEPAGSPERSAIEWWRAVQFGDAVSARVLYVADARPSIAQMRRQLGQVSSAFVGQPDFESFDSSGQTGNLYFFNLRPGADGGSPRALTLHLQRVGDRWLLADNELIEDQLARMRG